MTEDLFSQLPKKDDLIALCANPRQLLLLNTAQGEPCLYLDALSSTDDWASLKAYIGDELFNIGWNGTRLSYTQEARKMYGRHQAIYVGIHDYLEGMSPTEAAMKALDLNAVLGADLREPLPMREAVNQVIDLSDLVEPYNLFVRARSMSGPFPEFVTLEAGKTKKWTRKVFALNDIGRVEAWMMLGADQDHAKVIMEFITSATCNSVRALVADRPVIDLRKIADQPHD